MQRIWQSLKTKKTARFAVFLSVNNSWWSIGDGNITFGEDLEIKTKAIRQLLDESKNAEVEGSCSPGAS